MLKPIPAPELNIISNHIRDGHKIDAYKHHQHPDVRALVASTKHAPQAYILDSSPEVRLALIKSGKWVDRIAPNEKHPQLILEIIKQGVIQKKWLNHEIQAVKKAAQTALGL